MLPHRNFKYKSGKKMKVMNIARLAAIGTVAAVGFISQSGYATKAPKLNISAVAPYQNESGAIDFNAATNMSAPVVGLDAINAMLKTYGLSMVVPAGVSSDFTANITAQIKTIANGQIATDVVDHFNLSTYHALVVTMPKNHGYEMNNRDIYLIGKIPAAQTPVNGGLLNAFAYMSGRDSQAPALSITTQAGLALSSAQPDMTTINNTAPDVGDVINPADYKILTTEQSNKNSANLFFGTINPSSAWWDDYYYFDSDNAYQHDDKIFSDWKSDITNWYPATQQDAYISLALPYGDTTQNPNLTEAFQVSYIGYGQGYAPDMNADFANIFPNRPLYFAQPSYANYQMQTGVNWYDTYLKNSRRSPVLANNSKNITNKILLDNGWDNKQWVSHDSSGHAVMSISSKNPSTSTHLQINDPVDQYYLKNGDTYTYTFDISAVKDGQAVALTAGDTDLPTLMYNYSKTGSGVSHSALVDGKLQLNIVASCDPATDGQTQEYCPAKFSVYKNYKDAVDTGRIYRLTNPTVTAAASDFPGDAPFWINTPQDQYWTGDKVFYADFSHLQDCSKAGSEQVACRASNAAIEKNFNNGFMSMAKQWGGQNGGVDPMNVKLIPSNVGGGFNGHMALTESDIPLVRPHDIFTSQVNADATICNANSGAYSALGCEDATHFISWYKTNLQPLVDNHPGTPAAKLFTLLGDISMQLRSSDTQINVLDLDASYTPSAENVARDCDKSIDSPNDLCRVTPSTLPDYCTAGGANKCVFWALNTSDDHKDMQQIMADLHVRTGAGVIARNRAASGRYMMCVKMPTQTGASFSSWLFGYQSFLQGDHEWLHQNGAKRNSELDFMESSYFNPNHASDLFDPSESDFGAYGGMISNAGSASFRDYYPVSKSQSANHYVWMGYEYHTGTMTSADHDYAHADTYQLNNSQVNLAGTQLQNTLDSVQNTRSGDYVDIYVDPTVNCTADGINDANFNQVWQQHATPEHKITGESQTGKTLPHTIMGGSKGLGWLPYRYMRWTVALWNPAMLTSVNNQTPYTGWSGTPLGSYVDGQGTHKLEADISYLAMQPATDPRDKIEYDTGATYWSNQYDDSALNMQQPSTFSCNNGTIYTIKDIDGSSAVISGAFANKGLSATLSSQDAMAGVQLATHQVTGNTYQVCVPTSKGAQFKDLIVKLKVMNGAQPAPMDCFSNNSSTPLSANIDMHGDGANAYPECKFAGA